MPLILITNDDGIHSPGLHILASALRPLAHCVVIAPDRDNSAVSHSLTMNRPLKVTKIQDNHYSLDGTPTDCVAIGLKKILEQQPDLLVSGINPGPNLGDDIAYSGTVSAAVEGTMYGIHPLRSPWQEVTLMILLLLDRWPPGLPVSSWNRVCPKTPFSMPMSRQSRQYAG